MSEIKVTVRLFASLRESVGRERVDIALPSGAAAADAWSAIPGVEPLPPTGTRYAVNGDWAAADQHLHDGDELALILPVSGG